MNGYPASSVDSYGESSYTCGLCHETFDKEWSDEEALAEAGELFPGESDMAVVCDDCWHKMGFA